VGGSTVAQPVSCRWRLDARIRFATASSPQAGFGIGVGTVVLGEPHARAVQYDLGWGGYRSVSYPGDETLGELRSKLDHEWHEYQLDVARESLQFSVDGVLRFTENASTGCGKPLLRVWNSSIDVGSVELMALP
jgi:hypothetical protein